MKITPKPLTASAFEPYGQIIEATGLTPESINAGTSESFTNLASIDVVDEGGSLSVNIYNASPRELPFEIEMVERHPLGSQAFIPMAGQRFVVLVSVAQENPEIESLKAFVSNGSQGINLAKGVWHHPFLALDGGLFLVLDRKGDDENCEEFHFDHLATLLYQQ